MKCITISGQAISFETCKSLSSACHIGHSDQSHWLVCFCDEYQYDVRGEEPKNKELKLKAHTR